MWTNVIYLIAMIVAGAITTGTALHFWINRRIIDPDISILLVICLWFWITAQIGECVFAPLDVKIVFYKIKFIAISFVVVSLLGYSLQYVLGKKKYFAPLLGVLAIPSVVFILLSFSPLFERVFWKKLSLAPNNLLLAVEPQVGYVIFNAYNIMLILAGYLFILLSAYSPRTSRRIRPLPFLIAVILSTVAGILDFFFAREILYYRFLPIALALSSLSVIYYLRLRYFRTIPLAQHAVSQSMSDGLIILNPDNEIVYVNPAAFGLFQAPLPTIIGKPLAALVGGLAAVVESAPENATRYRTALVAGRTFDVSLSPIHNRRGRVVSKVFVLRDVTHLKKIEESLRELTSQLEEKVAERTQQLEDANRDLTAEVEERKKAEARLQGSLEEKSVLLGELHHRVKNNLQIVSSLLRLQSHYLADPRAQEFFEISVSRIRSMAMVHEKLYKSDDLAHTHFGQYIHELVHSVIFSHSKSSDQISLSLDVAPIDLDIDKSILAGLIINELVMNSLKHAFPPDDTWSGDAKNRIAVSFRVEEADYVLEYGDNGPGLPEGFKIEKADSLGLKIVSTLVRQLKGSIEYPPQRGLKVLIRFPVQPA